MDTRYVPMKADFNPESTAQAEYAFWRAHNDKDVPRLRAALESWTGELYGLDPEASAEAVEHLLEATQHHDARDWDAATKCATQYYQVIAERSDLHFSPRQAGALEVTWWRIHDDLEHKPDKTPLVQAFARLYAEVFGVSPDAIEEACKLKAQATVEHDLAEDPNTAPDQVEEHWGAAARSLEQSYQAMKHRIVES